MGQFSEEEIRALREELLSRLGKDGALYPETLEARFPHILKKMVSLWGSHRFDHYCKELKLAGATGKGFPAHVLAEIVRMADIHHAHSTRPGGFGRRFV